MPSAEHANTNCFFELPRACPASSDFSPNCFAESGACIFFRPHTAGTKYCSCAATKYCQTVLIKSDSDCRELCMYISGALSPRRLNMRPDHTNSIAYDHRKDSKQRCDGKAMKQAQRRQTDKSTREISSLMIMKKIQTTQQAEA